MPDITYESFTTCDFLSFYINSFLYIKEAEICRLGGCFLSSGQNYVSGDVGVISCECNQQEDSFSSQRS